ncbi:MAG: hypothetical protein VXZ96_12065 [Myxococcota bacterium]|nr:hypothetical protein [Myxococcota bacterium]MEC8381055.1 hypothetical protein [Myxococcota bacterium]
MLTLLFLPLTFANGPRVQLRTGVEQRLQAPTPDWPANITFCGEVRIAGPVSLAACGNGSGILHQRDVPDVAHFRLQGLSPEMQRGEWNGRGYVGGGFMEIQRGPDAPGFQFGPAEAGQVEAAGPELSLGFRLNRVDTPLILDLSGGVAHVPGATVVFGTEQTVLPSIGLTVGVGY